MTSQLTNIACTIDAMSNADAHIKLDVIRAESHGWIAMLRAEDSEGRSHPVYTSNGVVPLLGYGETASEALASLELLCGQ